MHLYHARPVTAAVLFLVASIAASAQVSPALQRATVSVTSPAVNTPVTGTVWLNLPGQDALEPAIAAIYDPGAPTYQKFFTWATLAPYLPTTSQLQAVRAELAAHNLTVTQLDPHNLSVSFQGQAGDFQTAFHTTIEQHTLANGKQVRAFASAPALQNGAAGLVHAVTGVGETAEESALAQPTDPRTGKLLGVKTLQQAAADASAKGPSYCFSSPASVTLTTPGAAFPAATYTGPLYNAPLTNVQLTPSSVCSYTPAQLYAQTGLDKIHAAGYTGDGQTIAILEQIGSPTLASDLAAFDKMYNLPAANLQIIDLTNNPGPSTAGKETTLDVESANAVAPGAKIVVVDVNGGSLLEGLAYVVNNHLANVVSMSYGNTELEALDSINAWNEELMIASALAINVDVSSDDFGDEVANEGGPDVDVPADSPYATGVGGLSIAYVPGTAHLYKTSYGIDLTLIGQNGFPFETPQPIPHGTNKFGSGGGVSTVYPVPGYQAALGGSGRHVPDVSDLASAYTGLQIVYTDPSEPACAASPCVEVAGGTSLATPIFSAKWALLDQLVGFPLGQAAPLIAEFSKTPAIEDIVPQALGEVTGSTLQAAGTRTFSASQLAAPETSQPFVSGLWQAGSTDSGSGVLNDDYVVALGTDSSLAVTPGYDAATGWGQLDIGAIFSILTNTAANQ